VQVQLGSHRPVRLPFRRFYEQLRPQEAGLLGSSFGTLEVSVREGRAERRFRARVGTRVRLKWVARALPVGIP
jgi:S-adenosylmethionine hydrolase